MNLRTGRLCHAMTASAVYIEQYALSHGLRAGDAIIAATAAEHGVTLCTGNAKHFNSIQDLKTKIFKPSVASACAFAALPIRCFVPGFLTLSTWLSQDAYS